MTNEIPGSNRVMMTGFQQLLWRKCFQEKHWRAEDIAAQLNIGRSTMYRYIDGEAYFPPDLIGPLVVATGDIEFLTYLLQGTGYTLAPLPEPNVEVERVEAETLEVAREAGNVAALVREALKDRQIDHREVEQICQAVRNLQREAQDVASACEGPLAAYPLRAVK